MSDFWVEGVLPYLRLSLSFWKSTGLYEVRLRVIALHRHHLLAFFLFFWLWLFFSFWFELWKWDGTAFNRRRKEYVYVYAYNIHAFASREKKVHTDPGAYCFVVVATSFSPVFLVLSLLPLMVLPKERQRTVSFSFCFPLLFYLLFSSCHVTPGNNHICLRRAKEKCFFCLFFFRMILF